MGVSNHRRTKEGRLSSHLRGLPPIYDITNKDADPLLCIDDILDALRGAKYFLTLDLAKRLSSSSGC